MGRKNFQMITFGHEQREANGEAQGLAKMATPENLCTTLEFGVFSDGS
jgi:hypothetical protein